MQLSELRKTPHLSASSINEYVECSLLYRFGRVDRLPMEFVAAELEFGTAIHKVLEEFYRAKMIGEKLLLKDLHELFKTHLEEGDNREGRHSISGRTELRKRYP